MVANYKKIIAKKLIKRYDSLSFGYGDSQADIPFVSVCDEQFLGSYFS